MSFVLLALAVPLVLLGRSATRRPDGRGSMWAVAMAVSELAGWFLIGSVGLLMGFIAAGWAGGPAGVAARVLLLVAVAMFVIALARGHRSRRGIVAAIGLPVPRAGVGATLWPIARAPRRLSVHEGLSYGPHPRQRLDLLLPAQTAPAPRPVFVHVHGGGWLRGRRNTQARPIVYEMLRAGWAVMTPSYRLSPEATFPDHLVDVKRSIAWLRTNAGSYDIDSEFIALSGGSTGGNLAALAALTGSDRLLQPGFDDADVSVQACIPVYGVHDLLDESGRPLWSYLVDSVMGVSPSDAPETWAAGSPIHRATSDRPPFLIVHGGADTLVDPALSRRLAAALTDAGGPDVQHLEVSWGNHGFDFFAGPRGRMVAAVVRRSLEALYQQHRAGVER